MDLSLDESWWLWLMKILGTREVLVFGIWRGLLPRAQFQQYIGCAQPMLSGSSSAVNAGSSLKYSGSTPSQASISTFESAGTKSGAITILLASCGGRTRMRTQTKSMNLTAAPRCDGVAGYQEPGRHSQKPATGTRSRSRTASYSCGIGEAQVLKSNAIGPVHFVAC